MVDDDKTKPSVEEMLISGFAKMDANINLVLQDVSTLHGRVDIMEERQAALERWRAGNSERVRNLDSRSSNVDMEHEAKLSVEIVERQQLAQKVDALDAKQDQQLAILSRLDAFARNPLVTRVLTAAGTAILTWLTMKGIR